MEEEECVSDRHRLPNPKCRHVPKVRISSHEDLEAARRSNEAHASTLVCDRPGCIEDAKEWVAASAHRDAVVIPLEWATKETR